MRCRFVPLGWLAATAGFLFAMALVLAVGSAFASG